MAKAEKIHTVILVHGAWGDGSGWRGVTRDLQARGVRIVAAQIPLTSLADDAAAVRRHLDRVPGPVVLVGHSYGGAVITAAGAGNAKVAALVYVAAIVPDAGETVGAIFGRAAPHPLAPALAPDKDGLLWVDACAFRDAIAPDAPDDEPALLAASQKPIALACLTEPMGAPAWREKPSWFLVAEADRMVSPATQHFVARRMGAEILSVPTDHWPLASAVAAVSELIMRAVAGSAASSA
jgi:pimeloyl-ACP methyl ester carboxylesterase